MTSASRELFNRELFNKGRSALNAQWRLRGATQVAKTARLDGKPYVRNYGTIIIGDRARLVSTVGTTEFAADPGGTLEIGERVFINYGCNLSASLLVRIGADSHLGPWCMVMDNSFHHIEPELRLKRPESAPVILEENVWLAARVIVLPGVTIGEGSVVGAGSVVNRDIPPRTLAAGMPAKPIRDI